MPEHTSSEHYPIDAPLAGRTLLIAASYVILRRGNEVLLQRRHGTGYMDGWWATMAGHVDPGESVHDAAVREVHEEAGVEVRADDLHPLTTIHRFIVGGPPIEQRMDVFFEVWEWLGTPQIMEPDKASAMQWFALDALPAGIVPHEALVLEALQLDEPLPAVISLRTE